MARSAFSDCRNLKHVRVQGNIKRIRDNAFSKCYALESITGLRNTTQIDKLAFFYCDRLRNSYIPMNAKFYQRGGKQIQPKGKAKYKTSYNSYRYGYRYREMARIVSESWAPFRVDHH